MVTRNVTTFRRAIDAFNDGDMEALAELLDGDSEWDWSRSIGPDRAVYKGDAEIVGFWREFAGGFEEIRIEIEELVDRGDRLIAAMRSLMRGRGGIEVEARNGWLVTLEAGKLRRLEMFQGMAEARAAAEEDG